MNPSPRIAAAARCILLAASAGIPLSLLWDFSWESTIGIDLVSAPPHVANYLAVALAAIGALMLVGREGGVRLGRWRAPLGAWVALWGALAFVTAFLFDRWWQSSYGLAAGIWHPPQLLKATAFSAITIGAWLAQPRRGVAFSIGGGIVLALVFTITLATAFANRQHGAAFHLLACGTYPIVLVALASSSGLRLPATNAALAGMLLVAAMVWLLPLVPGSPQVAPIYHPRDHLLPPPFPPLLLLPALALDALLSLFPKRTAHPPGWPHAIETGLAFFIIFLAVQWPFAQFLLSPGADHWFFAGGGKHWPFFLRIDPTAEAAFWKMPGDDFTLRTALIAAGLAILASRTGLWIGSWIKRAQP